MFVAAADAAAAVGVAAVFVLVVVVGAGVSVGVGVVVMVPWSSSILLLLSLLLLLLRVYLLAGISGLRHSCWMLSHLGDWLLSFWFRLLSLSFGFKGIVWQKKSAITASCSHNS